MTFPAITSWSNTWMNTMEAAGIARDCDRFLFNTAAGKTGVLTGNPRARAAGVETRICNHTFRATGITAYLKKSGKLDGAQ